MIQKKNSLFIQVTSYPEMSGTMPMDFYFSVGRMIPETYFVLHFTDKYGVEKKRLDIVTGEMTMREYLEPEDVLIAYVGDEKGYLDTFHVSFNKRQVEHLKEDNDALATRFLFSFIQKEHNPDPKGNNILPWTVEEKNNDHSLL